MKRYILLLLLLPALAYAGGQRQEQAQDQTLRGNSTDAYAFSGADMAIRDCLATYSVLFGAYQDVKVNRLCLADKAQAEGNFEEAANLRCSYPSVRKAVTGKRWFSKTKCVESLKSEYQTPTTPSTGVSDDDEEDEDHITQEEAQELVAQAITATLKKQPKKVERVIVKQAPPEVQQQLNDYEQRAAKARAIMEGKE